MQAPVLLVCAALALSSSAAFAADHSNPAATPLVRLIGSEQQASATPGAQPAKRHSAFGQAMMELTRSMNASSKAQAAPNSANAAGASAMGAQTVAASGSAD